MYNTKAIIKDVNGKPVPQYFNIENDRYEVVTSENGMLRVIMVDESGNEIQSQNLVDQINSKLSELVEVIKNGI